MKKIVIGLSGGMDSTTLLGMLLEQGYEVHCCNFQYGSKHNVYERQSFVNIIDWYEAQGFSVIPHYFDLRGVFSNFSSNLLLSGGEIPEGHYKEESMKTTVVPGRNTIFASIMIGLAETINAVGIALGVHSGDHHIYPDCREDYIIRLNMMVKSATENKVIVITPLLSLDKTSILKRGYALTPPVPYFLTRTCYKNQQLSCGKCGSCVERLEAFANVKIIDPICYE